MDSETQKKNRDEFLALAAAMGEANTGVLSGGIARPRVSRDALARARRAFPDASESEIYEAAAEYDLLSREPERAGWTSKRWQFATGILAMASVLLVIALAQRPSPVAGAVLLPEDTPLASPAEEPGDFLPAIAISDEDAGTLEASVDAGPAPMVGPSEAARICEGGANGGACRTSGDLAARAGDLTAARRYYEIGCRAGNTPSCYSGARLTLQVEEGAARRMFARACDAGHAASCAWLSVREWRESHGAESETLVRHLTVACDEGDAADACDRLGILRSRARDDSEAVRRFRHACDLGAPGGCANLAFHMFWGRGMDRTGENEREALRLWQQACDGMRPVPHAGVIGVPAACAAEVNVRTRRPDLRGPPGRIAEAARRACELDGSTLCEWTAD